MLSILKRDLMVTENNHTVTEMMLESTDSSIRDIFLDGLHVELMVDPSKVASEVDAIPEFDEDQMTPEEMAELQALESTIPEVEL